MIHKYRYHQPLLLLFGWCSHPPLLLGWFPHPPLLLGWLLPHPVFGFCWLFSHPKLFCGWLFYHPKLFCGWLLPQSLLEGWFPHPPLPWFCSGQIELNEFHSFWFCCYSPVHPVFLPANVLASFWLASWTSQGNYAYTAKLTSNYFSNWGLKLIFT